MSKNILGEQISKYRKAAGLTQEDLGRAVGVSTQAVSRWECGGTPDVELLPAIADYLHVSVDALFGREGGEAFDLKDALYRAILNTPKEHCMGTLLEYSWIMQRASVINNAPSFLHATDMLSSVQVVDRSGEGTPDVVPRQITLNNNMGYTLYGLVSDMRFSLILPESEKGYAAMLKRPDEYVRLFSLLAKPHYLDMLIDIDTRTPEEHFTARLAASRLNISPEEASEILDDLSRHMMVKKLKVADETGNLNVYQKDMNIHLHIFLFFCEQIMQSVNSLTMTVDLRDKPVFQSSPGTGSLTPEWVNKNQEIRKELAILQTSDSQISAMRKDSKKNGQKTSE